MATERKIEFKRRETYAGIKIGLIAPHPDSRVEKYTGVFECCGKPVTLTRRALLDRVRNKRTKCPKCCKEDKPVKKKHQDYFRAKKPILPFYDERPEQQQLAETPFSTLIQKYYRLWPCELCIEVPMARPTPQVHFFPYLLAPYQVKENTRGRYDIKGI